MDDSPPPLYSSPPPRHTPPPPPQDCPTLSPGSPAPQTASLACPNLPSTAHPVCTVYIPPHPASEPDHAAALTHPPHPIRVAALFLLRALVHRAAPPGTCSTQGRVLPMVLGYLPCLVATHGEAREGSSRICEERSGGVGRGCQGRGTRETETVASLFLTRRRERKTSKTCARECA